MRVFDSRSDECRSADVHRYESPLGLLFWFDRGFRRGCIKWGEAIFSPFVPSHLRSIICLQIYSEWPIYANRLCTILVYFIKYTLKSWFSKFVKYSPFYIYLCIFRKLFLVEKIHEIPMIIFILSFYFQSLTSNCRFYGLSGWGKCLRGTNFIVASQTVYEPRWKWIFYIRLDLSYIFSNSGFISKYKISEVYLQLHKNHFEARLIR